MKKIALALISATLIMSCSKDSDNTNVENQDGISGKLKKVEEIKNNVVIKTSDYLYNEAGNISKLTINDRTKIYETIFNYDGNNKMISWNLKEYYVFDPSSKIEQINTLEYFNGKIVNICIDRNDNTFSTTIHQIDRIKFTYNDGLFPTSIQHYQPESFDFGQVPTCSDVTSEDNEELFEYSNGNNTRYDSGQSGFFSNVYYTIEYDSKNHYQSTIKPDAFKYTLGRSTKNNFSKLYEYNRDDNQLKATIVFENTYNSNDFITKAIERYYSTGSTTPSNTTIINYSYY